MVHGKIKRNLFFYSKNKLIDYFVVVFLSGTHHKKTCSSESDIARWEETDKFFQDNKKYLYPNQSLSINLKYEAKRPIKQTNGGWSDLRDRQLCLSFALKTTNDISHINVKT